MEDQVSLKELTNTIRLFKDEKGRHFESLQNNMSEIKIQLQHDIKEVRDNLSAMRVSLDNVWSEVESMKSQLQCHEKEIETLQSSVAVLSAHARVDAEKQERLRLDTYSRRENLRLIGIPETGEGMEAEEEACEVIVCDILRDMRITCEIAGFYSIHRAGHIRRGPDGKPSRRQIIMWFISRKDRNEVWHRKENISRAKKYPGAFFVQDYPREVAAERAELRRIAKKARDIHKMKVEIKYNKIVMVDSGVSYGLKELPQYLKN